MRMKAEETIRILQYIAAAYPNFEITEDRLTVWTDMLKDSSYPKSLAKVKEYIRNHKFAPSIAEVIAPIEQTNDMADKFKQWEEEAKRERELGNTR